jgi:hypothetical protein
MLTLAASDGCAERQIRPDGKLPRWRTSLEIHAVFGNGVVARAHTTAWGFLKQPDKQKVTRSPQLMSPGLFGTANDPINDIALTKATPPDKNHLLPYYP